MKNRTHENKVIPWGQLEPQPDLGPTEEVDIPCHGVSHTPGPGH